MHMFAQGPLPTSMAGFINGRGVSWDAHWYKVAAPLSPGAENYSGTCTTCITCTSRPTAPAASKIPPLTFAHPTIQSVLQQRIAWAQGVIQTEAVTTGQQYIQLHQGQVQCSDHKSCRTACFECITPYACRMAAKALVCMHAHSTLLSSIRGSPSVGLRRPLACDMLWL